MQTQATSPIQRRRRDAGLRIDDAAEKVDLDRWALFRWIRIGLLTPYKKRGDRRTHIDLAELPEAMRRAGRPGPKPRGRRHASEVAE